MRRPGIVHRLDATTSGLMVIARNGLAFQEGLFRDFKARRVDKTYLALCWENPKTKDGRPPRRRDYDNRLRMAITEDGRESRTGYRVLWSRDGKSLVECKLYTGRTHQIRVHLRAIELPPCGGCPLRPKPKIPLRPAARLPARVEALLQPPARRKGACLRTLSRRNCAMR